MNKKQYNELLEKINGLTEAVKNGGKGSGNFGHAGREGKVGGSAPSGVSAGKSKTAEKRAYDHLRSNYTELGFDGSSVDTDFADDKAMTIFSSLESSDIMQLAEDKVKADDIYYSLEGNMDKYYKEGRDNITNLQNYMAKTNGSIGEAIDEVISYGKTLARASQLPEDTKKDFWLMDKDDRSNPGNRARTLLDDAERRLLNHEFDSEGFTEFAKISQQRIQALREVITHYDEINERVLDAPRSDKIIQDPAKRTIANIEESSKKKTNSFKVTRSTYNALMSKIEKLEKQLNGGKGSGNFGHAGREGKIGGSAPEGSGSNKSKKTGSPSSIAEKAEYGDTIRVIKANPKTPNVEKEFVFQGTEGDRFITGASETSDAVTIPFSWIEKAELIKKTPAKEKKTSDKAMKQVEQGIDAISKMQKDVEEYKKLRKSADEAFSKRSKEIRETIKDPGAKKKAVDENYKRFREVDKDFDVKYEKVKKQVEDIAESAKKMNPEEKEKVIKATQKELRKLARLGDSYWKINIPWLISDIERHLS